MFSKKWMVGLVGGATLLMTGTASATTSEKMGFGDMVTEASACVIADVESISSERRDGQVVTLTTFKVRKAAFGEVGSTMTVVTPGGTAMMGSLQVSEVVAGSPRFLSGQDSLMLVTDGDAAGEYRIVGMNQGLFNVSEGVTGGNYVALPQSVGGLVSVDEAVEIIRDQRVSPSSDGVE